MEEFCLHPQVWFAKGDRFVRCHTCLREWETTDPKRIQMHAELGERSRSLAPVIKRSVRKPFVFDGNE